MRVVAARPMRRERDVADDHVITALTARQVVRVHTAEMPVLDPRLDRVLAGHRPRNTHRDGVDINSVERHTGWGERHPVAAPTPRLEPHPRRDRLCLEPRPHRPDHLRVRVVRVQHRPRGHISVSGPHLLDPVDRSDPAFGANPLRQTRPPPQRRPLPRRQLPITEISGEPGSSDGSLRAVYSSGGTKIAGGRP